jgi:hypothetical protein
MPCYVRSAASLCAAIALSACSTLVPSTTAPAPSAPYAATADEAVVVFYRRSTHGPSARGDALGLDERWSFVRVYGTRGQPLADLRATEHALVRLPPGAHRFLAKNWAAPASSACVARLSASLAAGRVYAVRLEGGPRSSEGCEPVTLTPVARGALAAHFDELAAIRSEQRTFLGDGRERSIVLDGPARENEIVRAGGPRLDDESVLSPTDGAEWYVAPAATSSPRRDRPPG